MPNGWRTIFSQPWWRENRPFARLVRHFLVRLVRSEEDPASSEVGLGMGALLGLLAAPGAMGCFILLNKYSSLLSWIRGSRHQDLYTISIPDKYMFVAIAMAVTGIVTVLKWDRILPDAQDYLNLAPLPVRPRSVLLANACAIAIAVVVLLVAVNAASSVFFPLFVVSAAQGGVGTFLQFSAIHALTMTAASLFAFCAVFALLGAISAILPREVFRACSSWLRGAFLLAFLILLMSGLAGPAPLLRQVMADPRSPVRFLPSLWFVGMYQVFQHRGTPLMAGLAHYGYQGLIAAPAGALIACGLGYRRRFAAALEGGRRPSQKPAAAALIWFLDLFATGASSFVRACHRFTVRAILRDEAHRMCIGVALGLGWLAGWPDGPLAAPLSAAYVLVLGLRLAFEMPAALPGAWIFRAVLDPREHETLPAARRVSVAFLTAFVLLPAMVLCAWKSGAATAALHIFYLVALTLVLLELQLVGFRKIPLTCATPGFRDHLLMLCLIQFLGYEVFTRGGAAMELWMLEAPWRFLLLPAAMAAAWEWNRRRLRDAREAGERQEGLTFENVHVPAVERLNLS